MHLPHKRDGPDIQIIMSWFPLDRILCGIKSLKVSMVFKIIDGIQRRERMTSRCPWKGISSLYEEFLQLVKFKVGNGRSLRFWEDAWAAGEPLAVLYFLC